MPSVLIIGASRGIGAELARQYLANGWQVTATGRSDTAITALFEQGATPLRLDITEPSADQQLSRALADQQFDLLILNAGVHQSREATVQTPASVELFDRVMHTNVLGPMRLTPVLARHAAPGAKLVYISSVMGSLARTDSTYSLLYRASKAALNMLVRGATAEYAQAGPIVMALHPGWVRTDLGGDQAPLDVSTSVTGLRDVIERATSADHGCFCDYTGAAIPW